MKRVLIFLTTFFLLVVHGRGGRYSAFSLWNHVEIPTGAIFNNNNGHYNDNASFATFPSMSERIRTEVFLGPSTVAGPITNQLTWKPYCTAGSIYSSVAIDGLQNSYFSSYDKFFYSLNANGMKRWAFSLSSTGSSTPALKADGTVVYVFTEDGTAYALSTVDGSLLWTKKLCAPVYSSPNVGPDGTIYVSLFLQGAAKSCGTNFLYVLNPGDGSVKWAAKDTYSYGAIASPTLSVDGSTVYVVWYLGVLLGFQTSNGALNPNHMYPNSGRSAGFKVTSTPTVNPRTGDVYYMDFNGDFYAVRSNSSTGVLSLKWSLSKLASMQITDITSSAAVSPDGMTVYVGSAAGTSNPSTTTGTLYAISANNGAKLWSYKTSGGAILSSPIVDTNGNIYFGSDDNNIYGLSPQGTLLWSYTTNGNVETSGAISQGGLLLMGSADNCMYSFGTLFSSAPTFAPSGPSQTPTFAPTKNPNIYLPTWKPTVVPTAARTPTPAPSG